MNNEMISIPRDKLKTLIAQCLDDAEGNPDLILEDLRTMLAQPTDPQHRKDDQAFNASQLLARAAVVLGLESDNTSWFEVVGEMEKASQHQGNVAKLESIVRRFVALDSQWHPDHYEAEKVELMTEARAALELTCAKHNEIEQLRKQLFETENRLQTNREYNTQRHVELGMENMRVIDECNILRTKLAERDVLLREVINGKSRIQFDGDLMHQILLALSADTEPTTVTASPPTKFTWKEMVEMVNDVLGCEAHKWPVLDVGHEMTGINFNSLARIIDRVQHLATK